MSDHADWEESQSVSITSYSFNPSAGTVTFTNLTVVDPRRVLAIYDTSIEPDPNAHFEYGTVLYLAENSEQASSSGNVLTLPTGAIPPAAKGSDNLHIKYDVTPHNGETLVKVTNHAALPATGTGDTLYLAQDTSQLWKWNGTTFVAV